MRSWVLGVLLSITASASAQLETTPRPVESARQAAQDGQWRRAYQLYRELALAGEVRLCEYHHVRLELGHWRAVKRAESQAEEEPRSACRDALWARLAEHDGERLRARILRRLALARLEDELGDGDDPRWVRDIRRRTRSADPFAERLASVVTSNAELPGLRVSQLCEVHWATSEPVVYETRCTVSRRNGLVVMRVISGTYHEVDEFLGLVRAEDGWRLAGMLGMVGNGRGELGSHRLRRARRRQVLPGGPTEIDAEIVAEVGEMDGCYSSMHRERRRTVCRLADGEWSCRGWVLERGATRSELLPESEGCPPAPTEPAWSVTLAFDETHVETRTRAGAPPAEALQRVPIDDAF
ncbi:MAG: hypothetical protein AAGE52_05315 [Myxococcota bacterium]